ncbi:MAG TPA: TraB/GumN family protein [Acidobacteriota bacterium]|nr:TraB/GumN family protein [Acidobacteriota bacterium]
MTGDHARQLPLTPQPEDLPKNVKRVVQGDREIYLVGTAHVSQQSVEDVRTVITTVQPDVVCVELDEARYRNLVNAQTWKNTDIAQVIREGKAMLLLSSLIMSSFQKRIGKKLGVTPGAELLEAVRQAEEVGARVVLADRDIQITLKRTWANLNLRNKFKLVSQLVASLFVSEQIDDEMIEELKQEEKLGDVLRLLAEEFPLVKGPLIDERDTYLAHKIKESGGTRVVAVVGAGHVPGILEAVERVTSVDELETIPQRSRIQPVLKWSIPVVILALFAYGFLQGGVGKSIESVLIWILATGLLSAAGTALALGHPLAIASAFVAAPLTTLHPLIAAGWVSGLVQALVKKPKVQDLENLPEDITSIRGFWANSVSRILLVVVFSNLGSSLGTFVAGSWIAVRLFS